MYQPLTFNACIATLRMASFSQHAAIYAQRWRRHVVGFTLSGREYSAQVVHRYRVFAAMPSKAYRTMTFTERQQRSTTSDNDLAQSKGYGDDDDCCQRCVRRDESDQAWHSRDHRAIQIRQPNFHGPRTNRRYAGSVKPERRYSSGK